MNLSPHLNFDGQCAEAFRFYEQCFGGKISVLLTYREAPGNHPIPPEALDKILHAHLDLGGISILGCDAPGPRYAKPQGIQVSLTFPTSGEAERVFTALTTNGGTVTMPFQQTFWSNGFGMAIDRFGIPWMINTAQAA